jgi:hypothetical protein
MTEGAFSRLVAVVACGLAIVPGAVVLAGQLSSPPLRPLGQAPPADAPTALVLGEVVDATTDRPIPGAIVTSGSGAPRSTAARTPVPQRVLTDGDGYFVLRDLPSGNYNLTAAAPGYLDGGYGQGRPHGRIQPLRLEDGQRAGDVVLRLWRASVISGSVTDETGAPMIGLTVLISRRVTVNGRVELRPSEGAATRTNDQGAYSAAALRPGEYVVAVPAGMTVVPAGQVTADAMSAAALRASGADALVRGGAAADSSAVSFGDLQVLLGPTNALAEYLPLVGGANGRAQAYPTTFHPSATMIEGGDVITLGVGDQRTADVQLRPVATASVSGILVTAEGPAVSSAVHLIPSFAVQTPAERSFAAAVTVTDQHGRFVFPAVAAGSYSALSWRKPSRNSGLAKPLPAEPALFAEAPVIVDDAPVDVTLALRRGAMLTGRILLEGASPVPRFQMFQPVLGAWFQPAWSLAFNAGPMAETRVSDDGEFVREGVPPGRYSPNVLSSVSPPPGWYLKSATIEGHDLLRSPAMVDGQDVSGIVITFADRPAAVSGFVTDTAGRKDASAGVLAFPVDYESWLDNGSPSAVARAIPAAQTGAYSIQDLPPGDYLIAAVAFEKLDDWQPEMVKSLAGLATRVTLANGAEARVDLRRR